jgi:hypothetical protein
MLLQNPSGFEGGILLQNSRGRGPYLLQTDTLVPLAAGQQKCRCVQLVASNVNDASGRRFKSGRPDHQPASFR